jgi:AcrR family transcriptional regulator
MVGEVGVERVTMRGIAARANLTAPAIYKHFLNKRALLDEVIATGYSELGQMMSRGQGVEAMLEQAVKFANLHPKLTLMMLAPHTDDHLPIRKLQTELMRARRPFARDLARTYWAHLRGHLSMRPKRAYG